MVRVLERLPIAGAAAFLFAVVLFSAPGSAANTWSAHRPRELPQTMFQSLALGTDGALWASALRGSTLVSTEPVFSLLRSADGGATWSELWREERALGMVTGKICALDAQHAWVVPRDYEPRLILTHDGGTHWEEVAVLSGLAQRLDDLCFVDAQHGWLAATVGGGPAVLLTADGGRNWTPALADGLPGAGNAARVLFLDAEHGRLAVQTSDSCSVFASADGGLTWRLEATLTRGDASEFQDLFQQGNGAWAVTLRPDMPPVVTVHRRNALGAWQPASSLPSVGCQEIVFRDELSGVMLGYVPYTSVALWLTTQDGGTSWEQSLFPNPGAYQNDIVLHPSGALTVVGSRGLVMRRSAAETPWEIMRWSDVLLWLGFPDDENGWAVGGGGQILRTEDRGRSWHLESWEGRYPWSVGGAAFPAADLGLAAIYDASGGQWRLIATDGAGGWTTRADLDFLDPSESTVLTLAFPTPNLGFLGEIYTGPPQPSRAPSQLWRTADGGETWALCLHDSTFGGARCVSFPDPAHGWVLAGEGVYRTADGGATWESVTVGLPGSVVMPRLLDFLDQQQGWLLRHQCYPEPAELLHTADGGDTWELRALLPSPIDRFTALRFVDSYRGWLARKPSPVLRTEDGGWTWQPDGAAEDSLFVENLLIHPSGNGWAVGQDDILVRQASTTWAPGPAPPPPRARIAAFAEPNPFTGATRLSLETDTLLPQTRLELFDARGRRIRVWQAGDLPAGATRQVWDGTDGAGRPAAAGVYYWRAISSTGESAALKIVRLR